MFRLSPVVAALLAGLLVATAAPAAPAAAPLPVTEVAPGVFVHAGAVAQTSPGNRGDIANIGFVVGESAVAVIDSGGSVAVAESALAAIRQVTDLPVRYLINTHMHPDHVFGNQVFAGIGATIIGHRRLPAALSARADFYRQSMREQLGAELAGAVTITLPDETVEREQRIDLGGRTLLLRAWETAHTDNDLTVLDEATGTLFAGDLLFMQHVPVLDGSIKGWLAQLPELAALDAERVVPGHGPPSAPWPQALEAQTAYLEALAADLRAAIAAGVPIAEAVDGAAAGQAGNWRLFEAYNPRNATAAFAELEWE
ncbi:quinoprotein relay system zinc metallohydrolase 2 [Aurantimonas sp. HBX-1]|uniref:quinoprotein relay system zinc metallohydrolase 2 n=1 Tax=Aurantimonas sp. HBX-1 TaxID=2906072 RepID=UPI001F291768|nr:quinoprotein relay system zinc metallohydrolase 2 [Aurantimonas sp. HBX-1]UIJ72245.1 quinoprotein relay system zinc metallohydrolase 2 [Aurantimonas sp. HBX-1]